MTDDTNTRDIEADHRGADQAPYTVINFEEAEKDVTMIFTHRTSSTGQLTATLELLADLPGGGTAYLEQQLEPDQALKSIKKLMDDQMDYAWREVMTKFAQEPAS